MEEELTDLDNEEIANAIREGCTSGRVDSEDYSISWSLTTNKFSDNE